jgi:hypothetical protein
MYFNNYIKSSKNQDCLDLGFDQWRNEFKKLLKQRYRCTNNGCVNRRANVQCNNCDTTYCSNECMVENNNSHKGICSTVNTKHMLELNTFLGWRLNPILSMIAIAKNKQLGPGILSLRIYESIFVLEEVPDTKQLIKRQPNNDNDHKTITVYITYITLTDWKRRYIQRGQQIPIAICDNNYQQKMVVHFDMEDMNKSQLHVLPICNLAKSEPEGLEEFITGPMSKLIRYQVPIPL